MHPVAPRLLVALSAVLLTWAPLPAQARQLGRTDFPNSGAPEAQEPFIRGVLLLHSFEYQDAAEAFRQAQAADADFALAYWGEAMTYNHPLWQEQDREAAWDALTRLGATARERRADATPREAMYLDAVEVLYGEGPKTERDRRYMDAMGRLADAYPEDLNARAFYALSILGSTDGVRDFATYMRAAAEAQKVFEANPLHPGAAHYIIHSFDDPVHAPLGLNAARAYSEIAPSAAHAQHMTSHIFVALGMWDDVVKANVRARDVQNRGLAERGRPPNVCGHYTSWLEYGYLMQGRRDMAARGMDACFQRIQEGGNASEEGYFSRMRARYVLDARDWDAADRWSAALDGSPIAWAPASRNHDFVTAYAALKRGDAATARTLLEAMEAESAGQDRPRLRIQELELGALLRLEADEGDTAVALLREAAALEEELPFEFGPPASLKPPHELLGEVLLELGRAPEAVEAFRASLAFTPRRTPSLEGLAEAASRAGYAELAADTRASLAKIQVGAGG